MSVFCHLEAILQQPININTRRSGVCMFKDVNTKCIRP